MLLDTSGLLCYQDADDHRHQEAVTFVRAAHMHLTHSYVLAEYIALCQARGYNRQATLQFSLELLNHPFVEVVWIGISLHQDALTFLQTRLDKRYSLCDAVSFLLMRERGVQQALTTDHHFEQEGFQRLLPQS